MLKYTFVHDNFVLDVIIPLVKDTNIDTDNFYNYRGITEELHLALLYKIYFEMCLLEKFDFYNIQACNLVLKVILVVLMLSPV